MFFPETLLTSRGISLPEGIRFARSLLRAFSHEHVCRGKSGNCIIIAPHRQVGVGQAAVRAMKILVNLNGFVELSDGRIVTAGPVQYFSGSSICNV